MGVWEYHSTYRGIDIWVWMPDGTPYTAYFDGKWHIMALLSTLKTAIDDFMATEPEPGGNFDVTGIVTPAKAGFLVEFWWGYTVDDMFLADDKTTDSAGKVHWRPWSSSWPMKVQLKIPAGQVVGGVEYKYAESGILTAWKDTEADLYLYPEAVAPSEPYAVIEDFVVPESLPEGSDVTVRILLRNTGALGRLDYYIDGNPRDPDRYIMVEAGGTPTVSPGATVWIDVPIRYFPMPAWNYTLIASNEDGTSYISRTITLSVAGIPTTLTITAPDKVDAGEIFTVYGNLFETETGILIPGMRINISYNGKSLGYGYTDPEGGYYIDVSINEGGVWTLKAEFPGTEALQASRSQADAVVTASPLTVALLTAGPITTGIALFMYGTS